MKSKFIRIKAQAGIGDLLGQPLQGVAPGGDNNWTTFDGLGDMPYKPNVPKPPVMNVDGTPVNPGRVLPVKRTDNGDATTDMTFSTTRYRDNPYVNMFNGAAMGVTAIANAIGNNKLKNEENQQLMHSLEPHYWTNMEADGLNNLPMYTKYGGDIHPGFAHEAFYGDISIYQYGGGGHRKYAAGGGLTSDKAAEILKDGTIGGKPITDRQRRYFGWVAGGKKQSGGNGQDQIAQIVQLYAQLTGQDPRQIMQQLQQMQPDQQKQTIQSMVQDIQQAQGEQGGDQQGQDQQVQQQQQQQGRMQAGGSVANYLASKGVDGSYSNRKKLFGKYFDDYSGTAEQNIKLLSDLQSGKIKLDGAVNRVTPNTGAALATGASSSTPPSKAKLQSGVVVDKRTNQGYIIQGGKVKNQFPVLTGQNPNANGNGYSMDQLEANPALRNTPMGAYMLGPNPDIYGYPGFNLNPISFEGQKPVAADLAMHKTYDPAYRDQFYNTTHGNQSYGCVNCRKSGIDLVRQNFPQGDTLMVIDSKKGKTLQSLGIKQTGGGCDDCDHEMKAGGNWIQGAIQHPGRCANPGDENCPKGSPQYNLAMRFKNGDLHKQTGGNGVTPSVYGLPDGLDQFADVEAESGEVMKMQDGGILKVADNANTHEQGGEMIPGVQRVLEDTARKRNDPASKALLVSPDVVEQVFGFRPKSATSHAKVFQLVKDQLTKTNKLYKTADKDANQLDKLDKTTINSLKLNDMFQGQLPTEDDVFNLLFHHQEGVKAQQGIKDDGSMKQYGGKIIKKAQAGIGSYSGGKTKQGSTTPAGNPNAFNFPGGLDAFKKAWEPYVDLSKFKTVSDAQSATYDYLVKNQPDVAASIWQSQGLTAKGRDMLNPKNRTYNADFAKVANQVFDKNGQLKGGVNLTPQQLAALNPAYSDNMLGVRAITPSMAADNTGGNTPSSPITPVSPRDPLDTSVSLNSRFVRQPDNSFHEPTYWSDIAAPLTAFVDSFRRDPELYNPQEFHQLRYKLLDPTAAITANQADFNAGTSYAGELQGTGISGATKAGMLASKYRVNNQVMSEYDNQNAGIKNNEITYNTQVRDKQSEADAQSRGSFYRNVQLGREAQRQQMLTSLGELSRVDQLKRRQNISGNLISKLSPAFNQYGEYNGYQYVPYLDPSVIMSDQQQPVGKIASKKGTSKTTTTTTWKDAAGRTIKQTSN